MFLFSDVFRGIKREHSPGISSGGTSRILNICYILSSGQFSFKIEVLFLQMPTNVDSKKKTYRFCPYTGEHDSVTTRIVAYFMQREGLECDTEATNHKIRTYVVVKT